MTATMHVRPPLGLPPGSVRALLALQITLIFWMLLLLPMDEKVVPIPLNMYFLLSLVMMFFVAHGKSIARRGEPTASPLYLPGGSIRFLILVGTAAVLAFVAVYHPDRLKDRLTPSADQLSNWRFYLGGLGIGFVLGYATRVLPFRHAAWFQAFQAWTAIIAMAILFLHMVFQAIINVSLEVPIEAVAWQTAVTGIAAFYFGSRS